MFRRFLVFTLVASLLCTTSCSVITSTPAWQDFIQKACENYALYKERIEAGVRVLQQLKDIIVQGWESTPEFILAFNLVLAGLVEGLALMQSACPTEQQVLQFEKTVNAIQTNAVVQKAQSKAVLNIKHKQI